jgi:hypothetical protein
MAERENDGSKQQRKEGLMSNVKSPEDLSTLSFHELLSYDIGISLKLEAGWYDPKNTTKHAVPFLSRNLLYVRRANHGVVPTGTKKRVVNTEQYGQKKLNLLLDLFHHEPDPLIEDMSGSTTSEKRENGKKRPSGTVKITNKRRKLNDSESVDNSNHLEEPKEDRMSMYRTWAEKLAANDIIHCRALSQTVENQAIPFRRASASTKPSNPTGNDVYLSSTARAKTPMFVHCVVMGEEGFPSVYMEEKEDRRCPFCYHDAVSDTGMMIHLANSHGDTIAFDGARSEVGELHILATFDPKCNEFEGKENLNDFVYIADRSAPITLPEVPIVKRSAHKVAALDVATRKKHVRLLEEMGADQRQIERYIPDDKIPVRQYFHSRTNQPIVGGDWDIDSDDDSTDDRWLEKVTTSLLDDFSDMSCDEKKFMKLWNSFIKSNIVIADKSIPKRCMAFIRANHAELKKQKLRQELVSHLHNLWDHGLVSSDHIIECTLEYDSLQETEKQVLKR